MCIEIDKCVFDVSETTFLVFIVSGSGLQTDPEKARAIVNWSRPTSKKRSSTAVGFVELLPKVYS